MSKDHFSMLPSGWIPRDGLDFFAQFLRHLQKKWLDVCDLGEQHLTDCVSGCSRSPKHHPAISTP
jgi:hypothetical protein